MIDILRKPDDIKIITMDVQSVDTVVETELENRKLKVYLSAESSRPKFICLRWNYRTTERVRVLGDKWERAYADLTWKALDGERFMPWYFLASNGSETVGCGVMVQPNSFVSFEYDGSGVCCWLDVRCGAAGVQLNGRRLLACEIVCEHYSGISSFEADHKFCRVMSPNPILPKEPVYGGNNWYYAYGQSSAEEIYKDTALQVELAYGNAVKPFMVIDDCWEINSIAGPWRPNEKFGDMKNVAGKIKEIGAHPGIWVRFLHDIEAEEQHEDWRLKKGDKLSYLDPSIPEVIQHIKKDIGIIKGWGFELIKHDFSTFDMFGAYGCQMNGMVTNEEDWSFNDIGRTSAEIVLDFYCAIREACGDEMMIIGCNTLSHLCAGLVEINRINDDTSGRNWSRTRALGINGLAFRLPQNNAFYAADADCIGIMDDSIDWRLNSQWLEILSRSGTPLFVSCPDGVLNEEQKLSIKKAYKYAAVQNDIAVPLDWEFNNIPQTWLINGKKEEFDWVLDTYPALLKGDNVQPY